MWLFLHSWSANWWLLSFKNWWRWLHLWKKNPVNSDKTSERSFQMEHRIPFKISMYKYFIFRHGSPGKLETKTFINDITTSIFSFKKRSLILLNQHHSMDAASGLAMVDDWMTLQCVYICAVIQHWLCKFIERNITYVWIFKCVIPFFFSLRIIIKQFLK